MTERLENPGAVPAITAAALEAGHEPRVEHTGKRFRLACSCGFSTPTNATRKKAFDLISSHVATVGLEELRRRGERPQLVRDTPIPGNLRGITAV